MHLRFWFALFCVNIQVSAQSSKHACTTSTFTVNFKHPMCSNGSETAWKSWISIISTYFNISRCLPFSSRPGFLWILPPIMLQHRSKATVAQSPLYTATGGFGAKMLRFWMNLSLWLPWKFYQPLSASIFIVHGKARAARVCVCTTGHSFSYSKHPRLGNQRLHFILMLLKRSADPVELPTIGMLGLNLVNVIKVLSSASWCWLAMQHKGFQQCPQPPGRIFKALKHSHHTPT